MTTIAYRNGIMAADSRAYSGGNNPAGFKTKIHRLKDGSLFGASSSKVGQTDALRRHVEYHGVEEEYEEEYPVQALVVKPNGDIYVYNDTDAWSGPITAEFIAVGSGEKWAHGAMMMGAGAMRAVEIACQCDVWSGGPITALGLHDDKE